MTIEEQLRQEILNRYKSIREFSTMTGIPYSTVDSVLKRGITNSGVGTIIKIFSYLDIDVESITSGELTRFTCRSPEKKSTSVIAPDPSRTRYSLDESNQLLEALGFIQEGEDLSDEDLEFLTFIVGLLNNRFSRRQAKQPKAKG